ncbi:hypothetical protein [Paludibaculum fermentans]|uniref:hypothetical protein n=1 Tax=Paludibaculum fermentans TaxID=1473598 RepID=UPI003EBD7BD3
MTIAQARIVRLLAHSTLLPSYVADPILAGNPPPLIEIVDALLIHALDCEATLADNLQDTLNHRRIVRSVCTAAFLAGLAIECDCG